MKKKPLPCVKWTKLNKQIEDEKAVCVVLYDGTNYTVTEWRWLEVGEDYAEADDECYQNPDGSYCGLVAYVEEMPNHLPYWNISKIFIGYPADID